MIEIKNRVTLLTILILDIEKKETISPNGNASSNVKTKIKTVVPNPSKSCKKISSIIYSAGLTNGKMISLIVVSPADSLSAANLASFIEV